MVNEYTGPVNDPASARRAIEAMGTATTALLAGHGVFVLGGSARAVHQRAVALEQRCQHAWHVRATGAAAAASATVLPTAFLETMAAGDGEGFIGFWEAAVRAELRADPGLLGHRRTQQLTGPRRYDRPACLAPADCRVHSPGVGARRRGGPACRPPWRPGHWLGRGRRCRHRSTSETHQFSSPAAIGRAAPSTPSAPPSGPAGSFVSGTLSSPGGPFLYDKYGRVVLLHGVNAVLKAGPLRAVPRPGSALGISPPPTPGASLPWASPWCASGSCGRASSPGAAVPTRPRCAARAPPVRPTSSTRAGPPTPTWPRLKQTVDLLGRYHVYSLLDMHQDVYSQPFRAGRPRVGPSAPTTCPSSPPAGAGPPTTATRPCKRPRTTSGRTT